MISNTYFGWISLGKTVHVESIRGQKCFYALEDSGYYKLLSIYENTVAVAGDNDIEIYEIPESPDPCIRPLTHIRQLSRNSQIFCMDLREFLVVVSKEDICIFDRTGKFISIFRGLFGPVSSVKWHTDSTFVMIRKCEVQLWNMYTGLVTAFDRKLPMKYAKIHNVTEDLQLLCMSGITILLWTPYQCRTTVWRYSETVGVLGRYVIAANGMQIRVFNHKLQLLGTETFGKTIPYGFGPPLCKGEYVVVIGGGTMVMKTCWVAFYTILLGSLLRKSRLSDPRIHRVIWGFIGNTCENDFPLYSFLPINEYTRFSSIQESSSRTS